MISGISAQKCASARLAQSHGTALWYKLLVYVNKRTLIWHKGGSHKSIFSCIKAVKEQIERIVAKYNYNRSNPEQYTNLQECITQTEHTAAIYK